MAIGSHESTLGVLKLCTIEVVAKDCHSISWDFYQIAFRSSLSFIGRLLMLSTRH